MNSQGIGGKNLRHTQIHIILAHESLNIPDTPSNPMVSNEPLNFVYYPRGYYAPMPDLNASSLNPSHENIPFSFQSNQAEWEIGLSILENTPYSAMSW